MKDQNNIIHKVLISPVMWGFIGFALAFTVILSLKLAGEFTGRTSGVIITMNDVILAGYVILPAFILRLVINLQFIFISKK